MNTYIRKTRRKSRRPRYLKHKKTRLKRRRTGRVMRGG